MNWLTQPLERVFLRPLRSLGGLSFDVVVSEEHEDTLTIAKHPVEQGANISDHAYRNPCKVVIRGASSESTYGLPVWDPYNATSTTRCWRCKTPVSPSTSLRASASTATCCWRS